MTRLGFLHTAEAHVATFDDLVHRASGTATTVHRVRPELLERSRTPGCEESLLVDIRTALAGLAAEGADVIVCTCSTLGPLVEGVADDVSVSVLRVDRPMATVAVTGGARIAVIAALDSTLQPTLGLLADEARRLGVEPEVSTVLVPDAWSAFESGETAAYLERIAAAVRAVATSADVVVLAQASMAGVLDPLEDLGVPVLASPALAVERALQLVERPASVVAVSRDGTHRFSKVPVDSITLVPGLGVLGDAHAGTLVQHRSRVRRDPNQPNLRQVHLIHAELFDEARELGFELGPGDLGENVLTSGIDLLGLPTGTVLDFGDAAVRLTGLRNPCAQINAFRPGLLKVVLAKGDGTPTDQPAPSTADPEANKVAYIRKCGVMAVVERGGEVLPGQGVRVVLPPGAHSSLVPV